MKIINNSIRSISFGQAFTTKEKKYGYKKIEEAKKLLDNKDIIVIIPEASLPVDESKNIGIGQLNSQYSDSFLDFMKAYTGMNIVKTLPQGNYRYKANSYYGAYETSCLNLGSQLINLFELNEDKYGSILTSETLNKVIEKNKSTQEKDLANFENIVLENSIFNNALKEAYQNFSKSDHPNVKKLNEEFNTYKKDYADVLEPMALYKVLQKENGSNPDFKTWKESDKNLYNSDLVSESDRNERIAELKSKYKDEIEFSYFKEFLAEKNLSDARKKINKEGLKLMGDCQIGFSKDEQWAHPKAFADANICSKEWDLPALDYVSICNDGSESNKLIKRKVELFAKRYDAIRFDVGWSYTAPILYCKTDEQKKALTKDYKYFSEIDGYRLKNPLGDELLNIVEDTIKKTKGDAFNKDDFIYEVEAGVDDFSVYDWEKHEVIDPFKNRKIVQSTCYMDSNYTSIDAIENQMKVPRDNYVLMVGNHDHLALNAYAEEIDNDNVFKLNGDNVKQKKDLQYPVLSKELQLDEAKLKTDKNEFIKAKFAHLFLAKNIKMFFMDIFGRKEQFDSQRKNSKINYRYTIPSNYEESFHTAVQNGNGFNIYDSLAKAMRAKGLDKDNQKLYNELNRLSKKLYKKGVKTEAEANKKHYTKVAIIALSSALGILAVSAGIFFALNCSKKHKKTEAEENDI